MSRVNKVRPGNATTRVFWYIDDCPIPSDIDLSSIYHNIRVAVEEMGFRNPWYTIYAYGEKELTPSKDLELSDAGIFYTPEVTPDKLVWSILIIASTYSQDGIDLVVISKNLLKDTEFTRVLCALKSRGCNILLVQPPPDDEVASKSLFQTPESVYDCTRLFVGGNSMDHSGSSQGGVDNMIPDFSNPILPDIDRLRTAVFWNVEDCPIPNDLDPLLIYKRIKLSMNMKGYKYIGEMSIWAYAEKKTFSDDMLAKYRNARIYFIPDGNKYARVRRMLHDIVLWEMDSPVDHVAPPNLIVISNEVSGDLNLNIRLKQMNSRSGFNVFLVQPNSVTPENLGSSVWPKCLFDIGRVIGNMVTTYKPLRKKKPKVESPKAEEQDPDTDSEV